MPTIKLNIKRGIADSDLRTAYQDANRQRMHVGQNNPVGIEIAFDNGVIVVNALGPQLEVVSYSPPGIPQPISFGNPGTLRYKDPEMKLTIDNDSVNSLFAKLAVTPPPPYNFDDPSRERGCLLLAIFLASEAIRNEALSEAYIQWVRHGSPIQWEDYLNLYRNWNTMSKTFYAKEYQRIFLDDIRNSSYGNGLQLPPSP